MNLKNLIIIKYNFNLSQMKNILTIALLLISLLVQTACESPAPTELINDSDGSEMLEYEILTNDLNENVTSGTDTSGIFHDLRGVRNLISLSGIKITNESHTAEFCLAQGFFFDLTQPVYYSNERLLGYRTIIPGLMKFNNTDARIVPYRVRFRDRGQMQDTLLGDKFQLYRSKSGWGDPFWFEYGNPVAFSFQPFTGDQVNFNIPTPKDITGSVQLRGSSETRNIEAILDWNKTQTGRVSIVVGLIRHGQTASIPVYRFGVTSKDKLFIPKRFFSEIPFQNFRKLVFTFIRSYEKVESNGENSLLISSQNIHSILIDIP
jgi:hypothetical protein